MIPETIFDDLIEEIAGRDVIPLVQLMKGKSLVSEFKLAEKLDMSVNHVRNFLYKLDAFNLVDSARKKDKKKGWYVYYWTLDMIRLRGLAVKTKKDRITSMSERIGREEGGEFFVCPDKHVRMNLEHAMEYQFRCQECDLPLEREDNKRVVNSLKKQIEKLTREVQLLESLQIKPIVERKLTRTSDDSDKKTKKKIVKKKVKKKQKKAKKKILKEKPKKRVKRR